MDNLDWRHRCVTVDNGSWQSPWIDSPRTVTAPRNAEQALSLMSAGVGALTQVELTDEERGRIWRLIERAIEAVGEKT